MSSNHTNHTTNATPGRAGKRPRSAQMAGPQAHESLLRAAAELFYREGVRAVGVDAVVERAGVNKMSLYRQFSSKDDLVIAYLDRADAAFFARFDASIAQHPGDAARQLKQYFSDLAGRASVPAYRGCPFVNVAAEFPDPGHPARVWVEQHKAKLMARLTDLTTAAGADDPAALANALALLIEGVYAASQTYGAACGPIQVAAQVAAQLIDAACGSQR